MTILALRLFHHLNCTLSVHNLILLLNDTCRLQPSPCLPAENEIEISVENGLQQSVIPPLSVQDEFQPVDKGDSAMILESPQDSFAHEKASLNSETLVDQAENE
jgi:hypothetical protein